MPYSFQGDAVRREILLIIAAALFAGTALGLLQNAHAYERYNQKKVKEDG